MNLFKQALADRRVRIGLWQALASPYTAEICAGAGFDWLLFDGEHAPNDIPLLLAQLQAVAAYPVEPVVRLPVGDPTLIKQVLDIGARSLLIPMVETAEQARRLVQATRYPPAGIRGVGSAIGRAGRWARTTDYLREAEREICLLLQVESRAGLENVDAIAGTEGVDGVFIGPSDLSAALGHIGNPGHAEVRRAIEGAIQTICGRGKAAGLLMADETMARHYLGKGAAFLAVGTDVTILARGAEALSAKYHGAAPASDAGPGSGTVY